DAYTRVAVLTYETPSTDETRAQSEQIAAALGILSEKIEFAKNHLSSFLDSVNRLPRLTVELNHSRRRLRDALGKLIEAVTSSQTSVSATEEKTRELLAANRKSNIEEITHDVFERRKDAYEQLA